MRLRHVLLLSSLAACGSDGTGPIAPGATAVAVVTQPAAVAQSGVPLPQQPVVTLQNASGAPVSQAGVLITAVIASGGGSLGGTTSVRTDADGRATWTDLSVSGLAGPRTLRFEAPGLASAISGAITLVAGAPASVTAAAGNNQVAPAGSVVPVPPRVRVTDAAGNPVPGVSVAFEATLGGGTIGNPLQATGEDGTAGPGAWQLGPVIGPQSLTATAAPGISVVLSATATVGQPAVLEPFDGNLQSGTLGAPVAVAPAVRVLDAFGNPVPGITVTFTPGAGSGTVTGGNATSNSVGVARVQSWTLGFTVGQQTLVASRTGATPATLTATGVAFLVERLGAGLATNCATDLEGKAWCWGANGGGQIGDGTVTPRSVPTAVQSANTLHGLVTGGAHSCALDAQGAAWCWGANAVGQLGDGSVIPRLTPTAVLGGHHFTQLAAGTAHTCGRRDDGQVLCWGSNANGRLGDGTTTTRLTPVAVVGGNFASVHASNSSHTCGLRADGTAWCWGSNAAGRLGDGTTSDRTSPVPVLGGQAWQALDAGWAHTCGIQAGTGSAYCWGAGEQGQLGTGSASSQTIPVPVDGGHAFAGVSVGGAHSCAVKVGGATWCWGENAAGQLGDGTQTRRLAPVLVAGELSLTGVRAGGDHACGLTTAGAAVCWGRNLEGQLGDGSTAQIRIRPVAVQPPPATP